MDRDGSVAKLLAARTTYTAADRIAHLDKALLGMDLLKWERPHRNMGKLGASRRIGSSAIGLLIPHRGPIRLQLAVASLARTGNDLCTGVVVATTELCRTGNSGTQRTIERFWLDFANALRY